MVPITFDDQRGRANGGFGINQARTLSAAKGQSEVQLVTAPTVYAIQEGAVHENLNIGPQGKGYQPDLAYTLEARHHLNVVAGTLSAGGHPGSYNGQDAHNDLLIPTTVNCFDARQNAVLQYGEIAPPLDTNGFSVGVYSEPTAYDDRNQACGDIYHTLRSDGNGSRVADGVLAPISIRTAQTSSNGCGINEDGTAYTLDGANGQAVCTAFAQNQRDELREMDVAGALAAEPGMKQQTYIRTRLGVRRLTPRECERLQGYPDDHTRYGDGGKENADGPRYKMCGNGVAEPCAFWVADRLRQVAAHDAAT